MNLNNLWEPGYLIDESRTKINFRTVDMPKVKGVLDFYCRIGYELLANDIVELSDDKGYYKLIFMKSKNITKIKSDEEKIYIYYDNDENLNKLLIYVSSEWGAELNDNSAFIRDIIYFDNQILINNEPTHYLLHEEVSYSKKYQLTSINDFWHDTGLLNKQNLNLDHIINIYLDLDESILNNYFYDLCRGVLRIGLESPEITLPITQLDKNKCEQKLCKINIMHDEEERILLKDDEFYLYVSEVNSEVLDHFFMKKHYRLSGEENHEKKFLDKEQLEVKNFIWEIENEISRMKKLLNSRNKSLVEEVYLSKSYETRVNFKNELGLKAKVRSSYKTAYFWMTEEIIPTLLTKKNIDKIQISVQDGSREGFLELKTRWLQEMYPADVILSNNLSISQEKIEFIINSDQESTYKLTAFDTSGNSMFVSKLNVPTSEVTYLGDDRQSSPSTSAIVYGDSVEIVRTDRELFYEKYISEILPEIWETVKDEVNQQYTLFDSLEVIIGMEEVEEYIGIDNENISSLEALHEDIYFNTLDFFSKKTKENYNTTLNSPGSVLPFLNLKNTGDTRVSVRLSLNSKSEPYIAYNTKEILFNNEETNELELVLESDYDGIKVLKNKQLTSTNIKPESHPKWIAEESYRGRPIEVIEVFKENKYKYYSPRKLSNYRPTVVIEAGHHPNEVSSVYAVDSMINKLKTEGNSLMDNINFVFIKCANPDSYETQKKLAADNPYWKHHAARFNSVGIEFSELQFKETHFGEANVLPKVISRWLPDIHSDNHGIPNHEWTQPFSGYHVPPRFSMSYWIPNAFLYGLCRLPKIDDPVKNKIGSHIEKQLSDGFKDTAVEKLNDYWKRRYFKYGAQFLPDLFQIDMNQSFIFYKWSSQSNNSAGSLIDRFPDIISAEVISEVADETVYDMELLKCIEAQMDFNFHVVNWIDRKKQDYESSVNGGTLSKKRIRPLNI